jgi:hypothetical protein
MYLNVGELCLSLAWRPVLTVRADLRREHAYVGTFRRVLSSVSHGCLDWLAKTQVRCIRKENICHDPLLRTI